MLRDLGNRDGTLFLAGIMLLIERRLRDPTGPGNGDGLWAASHVTIQ
jgi:hypothetical protein